MDMNLQQLYEAMAKDPGWQVPPDAADSVLGSFGFQNPIVLWLLARLPEVLEWPPSQLKSGLKPEHCPFIIIGPYGKWRCGDTMKLRMAETEGRLPRRLVWKCFRHGGGVVPTVEIEPPKTYKVTMPLREMLAATQKGATIEFKRPVPSMPRMPEIVMPKRKRRKA